MPKTIPISDTGFRLRLPQDGPLIGATGWSADGKSVHVTLFATPDDSESDPALALLASYVDADGRRRFSGVVPTRHPNDPQARAPYFKLEVEFLVAAFSKGFIKLEVLTLHRIMASGDVFTLPRQGVLTASLKVPFDYASLRAVLEARLQGNFALLVDPNPVSHSFERRSVRS